MGLELRYLGYTVLAGWLRPLILIWCRNTLSFRLLVYECSLVDTRPFNMNRSTCWTDNTNVHFSYTVQIPLHCRHLWQVVPLVLPLTVLASTFGLTEIMAPSSAPPKKAMCSVHSPLLILANWTHLRMTFGSKLSECNAAARLMFFGASSLPPSGSGGKVLNLTVLMGSIHVAFSSKE